MSEVPSNPEPADRGAKTDDRRAQTIVGLWTIILGLLLLVSGVVLGLVQYNSPIEQTIRRGMVLGAAAINGAQVEGGGVITGASYTPPGPVAYVFGQPATWLGGLIALGGLLVFVRSIAPEPEGDQPEAACQGEPTCADAEPWHDEPFDTGD